MGEDGRTTTNFAVERRNSAPAEKREREECLPLELKTCSATPDRICGAALRPPTAIRSSSEPLWPAALHSSTPRQLQRAPPSTARLRAAHSPAARLRAQRASPRATRLWSHCASSATARRPPTLPTLLKAMQEPQPVVFHTCQVPPSAY